MHTPSLDSASPPAFIQKFLNTPDGFRWDQIELKEYKQDGSLFKNVTRQVLFDLSDELQSQLRYFEIAPGGYSTLERHVHVHAVVILQGRGHVLIGDSIYSINAFDLVYIPSSTWHQFRADENATVGFLCLVNTERDRPEKPSEEHLEALRSIPGLEMFIQL